MIKTAQKLLKRLAIYSKRAARKLDNPETRNYFKRLEDYRQKDKEIRFRTNYPDLNPSSVVFDLGGYEGQWASDIVAQYVCKVYVFEPLPTYADKIARRFKHNNQVRVFSYGLGAKSEQLNFRVAGDSTSAFGEGGELIPVELRSFSEFLQTEQIDGIDLMKINIEGGEFDLLEHLLDLGLVNRIKNLQVQFHAFVPDAKVRMEAIQARLQETHATTYFYPFFWENWQRKR